MPPTDSQKLDQLITVVELLRAELRRPDSPAADGMLSVAAAAKFSGIGVTKLYALMGSGDLPSVRYGRKRLIPRRGLVAFLESRIAR